jgi:hypothetical protein
MLGFLGSDILIEGDHNCYEKGELTSISVDSGGKERRSFSILMQSIVLYDLIVGSDVGRGAQSDVVESRELPRPHFFKRSRERSLPG